MALHGAALKDDYFVSRRLAPNVDFWRYVHICRFKRVLLTSRDQQWTDLSRNGYVFGQETQRELTTIRLSDGFLPRPVRCTPCRGLACPLAPGVYVFAAIQRAADVVW